MNAKTTIALLVLLLAIGGAAWLLGRPDPATHNPRPADTLNRQQLLSPEVINLKRLDRIEITRNGKAYVFNNTDTGWRMTSPANAPVNPAAITELTTNLAALSYVPGENDEQATGPDPVAGPAITLDAQGRRITLVAGETLGGGYCRVTLQQNEKQTRHTTEVALHHLLTKLDLTALLANRLDTPTALTAQRVEINSEAGRVVLRREASRWYLGESGTDQRALSTFIDGFTSVPGYLNIPLAADVLRYLPLETDNPAAYGLDQPRAVVRYTLTGSGEAGEARTAELRVGSPADNEKKTYFVSYRGPDSDRPVYAVMPWDFAAVLAKSADDFRDPRVMEIQPGLIGQVRGQGYQQLFSVPNDDSPDLYDVKEALKGLYDVRSEKYARTEDVDSAIPIVELRLTSRLNDELLVIRAYDDPNSETHKWVVRDREAVALYIPEAVLKAFFE